MHLAVHKVDEVLLTPELIILLLNGKKIVVTTTKHFYSG